VRALIAARAETLLRNGYGLIGTRIAGSCGVREKKDFTERRPAVKVQEIMTHQVASCAPDTDLTKVAKLMWDRDCGVIPVIDAAGRALAVMTDRDICMGVTTKGRTASHIAAREVMSRTLHACLPDDDVMTALDTMREAKVRRLPVIDQDGHLKGILSLNDVPLRAKPKGSPSVEKVVNTLKGICEHRRLDELAVAAG
jgi:CBS domain-containing protein